MTRRSLLLRSSAFGLLALLAFKGIVPVHAQASKPTDAAAFVSAFSQEGINDILAAPIPNTEKQQHFREMFKTYFDLPAIGRFVLTRYWKAATPEEQAKFTSLFEDVIVYTWSRRFSEYNGQSLMVTGQQPDGAEGTLVKSTIIGKNNSSFGVDWRLRKRPEGFKVLDIVIEGVSMAITYRQDYSTIIAQSGSFAGLLAQMEKQVVQLKAQQGA
jgi:phospholipid transport system substrate-binding protein